VEPGWRNLAVACVKSRRPRAASPPSSLPPALATRTPRPRPHRAPSARSFSGGGSAPRPSPPVRGREGARAAPSPRLPLHATRRAQSARHAMPCHLVRPAAPRKGPPRLCLSVQFNAIGDQGGPGARRDMGQARRSRARRCGPRRHSRGRGVGAGAVGRPHAVPWRRRGASCSSYFSPICGSSRARLISMYLTQLCMRRRTTCVFIFLSSNKTRRTGFLLGLTSRRMWAFHSMTACHLTRDAAPGLARTTTLILVPRELPCPPKDNVVPVHFVDVLTHYARSEALTPPSP
jgi:hypothetical protein